MLLATAQPTTTTFDFLTGPRHDTPAALPAAARRVMARLASAGGPLWADPRERARRPHFVAAAVSRAGGAESATLYTRDVSATALGGIGQVELMVGAKLSLRLMTPDGRLATLTARVRRCRPVGGGWHEVHAEFTLPQHAFDAH